MVDMDKNLKIAVNSLKKENHTCVLCRSNIIHTSDEKGILPMIKFISNGYDLKGFSVADKIVGKAAAMLFVLAGIKDVYASVISSFAYDYLVGNNINVFYDVKTEVIMNRKGDDICPMEKAVASVIEPHKAYEVILVTLKKLSLI